MQLDTRHIMLAKQNLHDQTYMQHPIFFDNKKEYPISYILQNIDFHIYKKKRIRIYA